MAQVGDRKCVLVVEDEALIRLSIEDTVEDGGYAARGVGSSAEALSELMLNPRAVSAAVVDVGLPDGRGDALCDSLRALRPDLPIVICTGYGLGEIGCQALRDGGIMVVNKPFAAGTILEALRAAERQAATVLRGAGRAAASGRPTTLERAFALARSGEVAGIAPLRRALAMEGYHDARAQTDGPAIQRQLSALMKAGTPSRQGPAE